MAKFAYIKPHRIYVAAASSEIPRAKQAAEWLKTAGLAVVSTWTDVIEAVGDANPASATVENRYSWSFADLRQVDECDLLWFLVPPGASPTRGAWLEVGYARAKDKLLVFSGETRQSIFCALGTECENDVEAFAVISRLAREGASV
jgi:hypothetical protein